MINEDWCTLHCGDCVHFNVGADRDGEVSTCKRIDHKKIKFWFPWFKCYDCGQLQNFVCSDFKPKRTKVWLCNHWTKVEDFVDIPDDTSENAHRFEIGLVLNGDRSICYEVARRDWFYNTFLNEDGSLKWIERWYYKRHKPCEQFPTGYEVVYELPDGTKPPWREINK